jgi:hypothetical protein
MGANADIGQTNQGLRVWKLGYKLAEKNNNTMDPNNAQGWNYFLRPNGFSSGQFQRLQRKLPGGYTVLNAQTSLGNPTVPATNTSSFPQTGNFQVMAGTDIVTVTIDANKRMQIVQGGFTQQWPIGTPVVQAYSTSLSGGVGVNDLTITVGDATPFPQVGQFTIQVQSANSNETMVVVSGPPSKTWVVLRGLDGTQQTAHSTADTVVQIPGFVYDLADFRYLFQSGLLVA